MQRVKKCGRLLDTLAEVSLALFMLALFLRVIYLLVKENEVLP